MTGSIITVATMKGGSGKSTVASCLAVYWQLSGRRPSIIDADPQRSIARLAAREKALGGVTPICLSNDYVAAINGNNYGNFLSNSAPRSALRKDVMDLAARFFSVDEKRGPDSDKASTAFRRLTA